VTLIEAQRLVRTLCTNCRVPSAPPASLLQQGTHRPDGPASFYQAGGCHLCNRTGYRGRMGILETLVIDEHLRELIVTNAPSWEIKDYAVKTLGMTTLHEDGLKKAAMGLTTLEEVLAVTAEE
jgi:type II secretory ATPase GspE/PulE/Tfp pilus assembly ATPase PilB-like protein